MVSRQFSVTKVLGAVLTNYIQLSSNEIKFNIHISTAERIRSHGYPAEEHSVETSDNYILGLFRIPYSHKLGNENQQRPVVLLLHGLSSCSDTFILTGPDAALAYNLVDAGYDVWLGNARGNYYSRKNSKISLNNPDFWRFSWHEIGNIDVPAMIDYILELTGEESLHYIGHSQGTTSFSVAMSTKPEYNGKIKTAHLLAPVAYMAHVTDPMLMKLSKSLGQGSVVSSLFGAQEFLAHNNLFVQLGYTMLGKDSINLSLAVILGYTSPNANPSILPLLPETHPSGGSTNQIVHFMQSMNRGTFSHFDHGVRKNLLTYGQEQPPAYDLSKIIAPVYLYYGDKDTLAVEGDVLKLASELGNVKNVHRVPDPTWSHADFTWATTAPEKINKPIIEVLNAYEGCSQ